MLQTRNIKMKLKFLDIPQPSGSVKATIHKTGKLGFSQAAIEELQIDKNTYVKIAENADDKNDRNLYMFLTKERDENALKISKAGNYYYANTKYLFDRLGFDYRNKKFIFDIIEMEYEENTIYKLIRREVDRN